MIELVTANTKEKVGREFNAWLVFAICFSVASIFMFFFGLNSPIHTFNSHCDYNWYITMGRGLVAGKVPYRDLFEQKGPITYFVFAFATLFSNYQLMIWFLEIVVVSLFLFFSYRIARKFLSPWLSLAVVPLAMMVLSANYCRGINGSCVEEFCLPIFAYGLLCFLDFIMDNRAATWRRSLAIGICLGILFWVKFSMLEFFFVPMLIWLIINLVRHRIKEVLKSGLIMLGGLLIITIPVITYFATFGALDDLWNCYFKINLCNYTGDVVGMSQAEIVTTRLKNILKPIFMGAYFILFMLWGMICFAVQYWRRKSGWLLLISIVLTWFIIGFFVGYLYYYIPLFVYSILGVIYLVKVVAHVLKSIEFSLKRNWSKGITVVVIAIVSFFLTLPFVANVVEINRSRNHYAPLVVADIINEYNQTADQPATLFCYRMSDGGFYNASNIIPNVYFFAKNSFVEKDFPEMYKAFDETIRNQKCDFVITYLKDFQENEAFLLEYYDFYYGSLESSTLPYVFYEPSGYGKNQIVVLYRKYF